MVTNDATYLEFLEAYTKIQQSLATKFGHGKTSAMVAALRLICDTEGVNEND